MILGQVGMQQARPPGEPVRSAQQRLGRRGNRFR